MSEERFEHQVAETTQETDALAPDSVEGGARTRIGDVGTYIREQRRRTQMSLRKLAEQAGVSNPYLSQIERGVRQPSVKILQAIAKGLRVSAETMYAQAGILEQASGGTDVLRAILRDTSLTEGQRRELAELYEQMRIETAERRSRRRQRRLRAAGGEEG